MMDVLHDLMSHGVKIPRLAALRPRGEVVLYVPVRGEEGFYRERTIRWRDLGESRAEIVLQAGAHDSKYEVATPLSDADRGELLNALLMDLEV